MDNSAQLGTVAIRNSIEQLSSLSLFEATVCPFEDDCGIGRCQVTRVWDGSRVVNHLWIVVSHHELRLKCPDEVIRESIGLEAKVKTQSFNPKKAKIRFGETKKTQDLTRKPRGWYRESPDMDWNERLGDVRGMGHQVERLLVIKQSEVRRIFFATYKSIGPKSVQLLDQICQILQIIEGLGTVLLGCFIEEYTPNSQVRVGRVGRPSGICLDILAH